MEVWKAIPNYNGYEVSSYGRFRSYKTSSPKHTYSKKSKIIKGCEYSNGYIIVKINKKRYPLHRLILSAFLGESSLQCNHINGIKNDNRLVNLEWVTPSENIKHAHNTGLISVSKAENHYNAKLTNNSVKEIKSLINSGHKLKDIALKFNVHKATISDIKRGKTWASINA